MKNRRVSNDHYSSTLYFIITAILIFLYKSSLSSGKRQNLFGDVLCILTYDL